MNSRVMFRRKNLPSNEPEPLAKKNLGNPLQVISLTIIIFGLSQLIAAFIAGIALSLAKPHSSINLDSSIAGQFFYILAAEGLAAYFSIWLVRRRRLNLGVIGLGRRPVIKDIFSSAIGFVIFYGVLIGVSIIVSAFSPDLNNEKQDLGFTNLQTNFQHLLAFVSLVIIPPLGEEVLVRGYLFGGLRKVWRFWPAMLVTSVLFGIAHLEFGSGGPLVWAAALDTFVLSVVLCFLREKTGAIYAGIVVHMLNNLIAFHYAFH